MQKKKSKSSIGMCLLWLSTNQRLHHLEQICHQLDNRLEYHERSSEILFRHLEKLECKVNDLEKPSLVENIVETIVPQTKYFSIVSQLWGAWTNRQPHQHQQA